MFAAPSRWGLLLALSICAAGSNARAESPQIVPMTPRPHAYGLLIGSNQGGPGQTPLRYAEEDARRLAQTLKDLGHYGSSDLRLMPAPSPEDVLSALDAVSARLREHAAHGEQAVFIF